MGMGDSSPRHVQEVFALTEDEVNAIQSHCVRPGTLFARFKTNVGVLSQILKLHASSYEKWCFTTQGRDQTLRDSLSRLMPFDEAIDLLVDRFPDGSAGLYLRSLADEMVENRLEDDALADVAAKRLARERAQNGAKLPTPQRP